MTKIKGKPGRPRKKIPEFLREPNNLPMQIGNEETAMLTENQAVDLSSEETQEEKEQWEEQEIKNVKGEVIGTKKVKVQKETFAEVIFSHKADKGDTNDVELSVDGQVLTIQRGKKVVLPSRFLECADHGWHHHYEQVPGKTRKIAARIQTYNYTVIRSDVPASEYFKMKKEGDKKTRDEIAKRENVGEEL